MACGVKGVVGSFTREYKDPSSAVPLTKPRPLPYSTSKVGGYEQAIVWHRYKITVESLERAGVRWAEEIESLVFPCYTIDGEHVGYVTKCLVQTNVSPKSLLFWNTTSPRYFKVMEWAPHGDGTVYLVEDCLSALKLWQSGVSSIALLGTKLDDSTALEISKAYRKVVFCLDNDATAKAVELSRKYNLLFDKVSILVPSADPKDMAPEELENLLYAGG
jgi:DNA primase